MLDTHDELIVDLFAGGGGASSGIEIATGRMVDIAINHNATAVDLHMANHPTTRHFQSDVFEVDPIAVTQGRPVGFLWASPDCTFHSKARGAKPIRHATKKRRALAWVVTRWAATAFPRVIMLENVEEFAHWGPLVGNPDELRPCKKRRGQSFRKWVRSLVRLGYTVEWRELRACDYGAPTIRKRFFLIARRDGKPIVWPEPTHGPGLKPYRTAAECIDWTLPMCSVFATKAEAIEWAHAHGQKPPLRPLAENTMRRIARGLERFVLKNPEPFLVMIAHSDGTDRILGTNKPLNTIQGLTAVHIQRDFSTSVGHRADQPLATVTCEGGGKAAIVASFLRPGKPLNTIPTHDRFGFVAVEIAGQAYDIVDIAMRMLHPTELYRAQGFPSCYIIDRGASGKAITKSEQVRMCGNSVCPPIVAALVRANCPELSVSRRRSA